MTDYIGANTLKNAQVNFLGAGKSDFEVRADDLTWTLKVNYDASTRELIFDTEIAPNMWFAIGLAYDLLDGDVIKWVSGDYYKNNSELNYLQNMVTKRSQSKVVDCYSIKGELVENNKNLLRSIV